LSRNALLALADGSIFRGEAIGSSTQVSNMAVGEVVFNTSITGYQEILTDPSYSDQLITLTYPHIGNVGVNSTDVESKRIHAKGLIIRQLPLLASSWRQQQSLNDYLRAQNIVGISQIDTRRLTRILRKKGALGGCIMHTCGDITENDEKTAILNAQEFSGLHNKDLAKVVTCESKYSWTKGGQVNFGISTKTTVSERMHVVAYDFGVKHSILRILDDLGCNITVVPAQTSFDDVMALKPDGVFLSNGPGDPAPCDYAIKAIKQFIENKVPLFGICLGYQLFALAVGAKTFKMKYGHHGGNHPVQDVNTQTVLITSQNHGFAVEETELPSCLTVTHKSLFDNTLQGLEHKNSPAFGFQGHPEAGPGPNEAKKLFNKFIEHMLKAKNNNSSTSSKGCSYA